MNRQPRGFTLVEAIVVMVIIGIVSAMVAVFIRAPVKGYVDSAARAEVTDEADLASRRIARDLRLALPNSVRIAQPDGNGIEFLLTKAGGRYLAAEDGVDQDAPNHIQALDFADSSKLEFTVLGMPADLASLVSVGDYIVVYNLGPGFAPADAYGYYSSTRNISRIASRYPAVGASLTSITLQDNPFAAQNPPMQSPTQRFQVVSGPVMYLCQYENGALSLRRYWGYQISTTQIAPPQTASSALIATNLDTCDGLFNYDNLPSLQRSGLVTISLALQARNSTAPAIRLVSQVHVDNTP
ncbi:MAG: prepilin-type N-terminal cleavage/methylation domain-containing protein [Telluria sp.]